jgi:hypothetical protein
MFTWRSLGVVVFLLMVFGRQAGAQGAWVEGQGSLTLGLNYNYAQSSEVVEDSSHSLPDDGVRTQEATVRVEYVPIRHLAVAAQLPFQALQYIGSKTMYPHPGGGKYDDGSTHYTLTDFRADVRYQLLEEPFALTPIIGFSAPAANYETVGNAVAGRHLDQLHIGAAAGRIIGDDFYVHLLYTFSLVQRCDYTVVTQRYGENHSDGSIRFGYKPGGHRFDINVEADGRITNGGLDFDNPNNTAAELLYHDAILHEDIVLVGPGFGYQVTDTLSIDVVARLFVWGFNTQNASVLGLGVTWSAL